MALQHLNTGLDYRAKARAPVGQRRVAENLPGEVKIAGRLRNDVARDIGHEPNGGLGCRRQAINDGLGAFAGTVKPTLRAVGHAHAVGIIEEDQAGHGGAAPAGGGGVLKCRPRERERQQREQQTPQCEQQPVLDVHPALVARDAGVQEAHCGPGDPADVVPVEQVDDNRHTEGAEANQHEWIQKAHGLPGGGATAEGEVAAEHFVK